MSPGWKWTVPTNPLETRATENDTEDCLFLNVYYPSDGGGAPLKDLPTVVWIHGGGYIGGSVTAYDGEDIIRLSNRGVVVVLIQYRLGLFGFLAGSAVKKNGALNAGLLDQDFALRWVNKYIQNSAEIRQRLPFGASLLAPALGAITSSTFLPSQYQFSDPVPERLFSEVLAQTDCATATDSMACLRAVDATILEAANTNISLSAFYGTFVFVPVVDGVFITQRPTVSMLEGKVNGEAILAVTNAFEGTNFVDQSASVSASQYSLDLFPRFSTLQAATVSFLYGNLGPELFQVNAVQGESIFICPTYYLLNAFPGRAFKGEFAIPPGLHGGDLALHRRFCAVFHLFIINLDPNIKVDPTTITPHWNTFNVIQHTEMLFNQTAVDGLPVVKPILLQMLYWSAVASGTVSVVLLHNNSSGE
ncbi:Alpha/Beta hydrolase protein [Mycena leptocephala]|nr:Alpha/Beta hydrolase protein [Mycena leptocephala]